MFILCLCFPMVSAYFGELLCNYLLSCLWFLSFWTSCFVTIGHDDQTYTWLICWYGFYWNRGFNSTIFQKKKIFTRNFFIRILNLRHFTRRELHLLLVYCTKYWFRSNTIHVILYISSSFQVQYVTLWDVNMLMWPEADAEFLSR